MVILRLQPLIQAGFDSAHNILEMDEEQVVLDLQRDEPNWLIEGALIEKVMIFFCFFTTVINLYTSP